jgi:hypothetical protein
MGVTHEALRRWRFRCGKLDVFLGRSLEAA